MKMQGSAEQLGKPVHRRKRKHVLRVVPQISREGNWREATPQAASRKAKNEPEKVRFQITHYEGGKRRRLFFKSEGEAKGKLQELQIRSENLGTRIRNVSGRVIEDAVEASRLLEPFGVSLVELATDYVARRKAADRSILVSALEREFRAERERKGKSAYYLRDLKARLGRFSEGFGDQLASDVTPQEIDSWMSGLGVGERTQGNFLRVVAAMFGFAMKRGYCASNPAAAVEKPSVTDGPPEIYTPSQVRALLKVAKPAAVPYLAIAFFAGLRPEEINRLEWQEIDFEAGVIEVGAKKSKTAQRRLVDMSPNLRAWLSKHRGIAGPVRPPNIRKMRLKAMEAAGIERWPVDVARHSFCSYHLAEFKDAAHTALQAGHSTTAMLFRHYRELVKPAAAKKYWAIRPAAAKSGRKVA